jgi:trehalose 6-phosphate phosphatase
VVQLISDLCTDGWPNGVADALTDADWNLVSEMVFAVESRWVEPDHGIWEIRGTPRHHVYSKVMCWLTWTAP